MKLNFNLDNVAVTEFGVGLDDSHSQSFFTVPVDGSVQATLREMAHETWGAMQRDADDPEKYEPSEKHGAIEHLYLPIDSDLATLVRQLHEAANMTVSAEALSDPTDVFCYFARLTDKKQRHLTAMRRATQFKG